MEYPRNTDDQLIVELAQKVFGTPLDDVRELAIGEQGASGAQVRYFQVGSQTFVAKHATLLERQVMTLLQAQEQAVPRLATDVDAAARGWLVMEFAEDISGNDNESAEWSAKLGAALAGIHVRNIGQRPAWLKVVSLDDEVKEIYCHEWRPLFYHLLATDDVFASLHGDKADRLETSWQSFKADLAAEMADQTRLTLISTDLTPSHWRQVAGKPVLIDWEQSRFGSLYLDLPNIFNDRTVAPYYHALVKHGVNISADEFADKFVSLSRYLGFRYMSVGLEGWPDGTKLRLGTTYWQKAGKQFFEKCLQIAMYGYPKPVLGT